MKVTIEDGIDVKEASRRLAAGDRSPELEPFMVKGDYHNVAEEMLRKGFKACYVDDDYIGPGRQGVMILEHPNGARQVIDVDDDGNEFAVRDIPPVAPPRPWLK